MALDAKYILARMNNSHLPELMKLKELALWNQIETDWSIFIDNYADHAFVVGECFNKNKYNCIFER